MSFSDTPPSLLETLWLFNVIDKKIALEPWKPSTENGAKKVKGRKKRNRNNDKKVMRPCTKRKNKRRFD